MKNKYEFTEHPINGEYGNWITKDGFKCFTNNRTSAVRWYKNWLINKR